MRSVIIGVVMLGGVSARAAQKWAARYDGGQSDYAEAIATDGSGNVYVTGYIGGDGWEVATVKYDSAGTQLWVRRYNHSSGSGLADVGRAITVDGSGNVYVTGTTDTGFGMTDYDILTIKYDTNGTFQWASTYNGGADGYDDGLDIAVGNAYVYVTGISGGNCVTLRLRPSTGGGPYTNIQGGGECYAIALDIP